jgi:hypothetical protein
MKTLVFIAFALALCGSAEARTRRAAPAPHIVNQVQHGGTRFIYLHNTQARPIWVYLECEKHLTVTPIGIPGARVAEIRLPDIEPNEQCLLNRWVPQVEGKSPAEWRP